MVNLPIQRYDSCVNAAGPHQSSTAVDAVVAMSVARLQGLHAQHHGFYQDACERFEAGIAEGFKALGQDQEGGMQWLLQDLLAGLQLDQADTHCCMVKLTAPACMMDHTPCQVAADHKELVDLLVNIDIVLYSA